MTESSVWYIEGGRIVVEKANDSGIEFICRTDSGDTVICYEAVITRPYEDVYSVLTSAIDEQASQRTFVQEELFRELDAAYKCAVEFVKYSRRLQVQR